jgi:rod shape-determining protein MreC
MKRSPLLGYSLLATTLIVLLAIPPKKMHHLRASLIAQILPMQKQEPSSYKAKLKEQIAYLKEEKSSLEAKLNNQELKDQTLDERNSAKVIFRDPAFWASSLLINQGLCHHNPCLAKNSPVLSNGCLIGVVEEVFETFSKVRLITDKNLQFSIKTKNPIDSQSPFIEVGTLCGITSIDHRYRFRHVEGVFFSPQLQVGDELITSGLDGLFPEGLPVAVVTDIQIDQEEVSFPFKALTLCKDIKDLKVVTILNPILPH